MKVIVKTAFRDKTTHEIRNVGEVFTCNKARFDEIAAAGEFVEEVKKDDKE